MLNKIGDGRLADRNPAVLVERVQIVCQNDRVPPLHLRHRVLVGVRLGRNERSLVPNSRFYGDPVIEEVRLGRFLLLVLIYLMTLGRFSLFARMLAFSVGVNMETSTAWSLPSTVRPSALRISGFGLS